MDNSSHIHDSTNVERSVGTEHSDYCLNYFEFLVVVEDSLYSQVQTSPVTDFVVIEGDMVLESVVPWRDINIEAA